MRYIGQVSTVLGIERNASDDEIKRAYRRLAKISSRFKPGDAKLKQNLKINEAYNVINPGPAPNTIGLDMKDLLVGDSEALISAQMIYLICSLAALVLDQKQISEECSCKSGYSI